jgi:hypothetical protein
MEEPLLEGEDGKRGGAEEAASVYAELYQVRVCPRARRRSRADMSIRFRVSLGFRL